MFNLSSTSLALCLNVAFNTAPCLRSLPTLSLFFCLGLCVYRLVAKPCAHILRIQAGVPRRAQPNDVLERVYHSRTVHKAFACSVVPLKSSSAHWSTVVLALKYTTTAIMIPSVPTKMWRDSHTYMSCGFFSAKSLLVCPLPSSSESGHKAAGRTLQATGLGSPENTEVVSRPPEPRQA